MSEDQVEKVAHLIENFVTWQGEGPDAGRPMIILRFRTCNLKCPWCDTAVKMRVSAEAPYKLSNIQEMIDTRKAGILVTGGEPTVSKHFDEAVSLLNDLNYPIANVESNGYKLYELIGKVKPRKPVKFMYSPKMFNSDDVYLAKDTLTKIAGHHGVFVKVVWDGNPAVKSFLAWLSQQDALIEQHRVWVMPQGVTRAEIIKNSEETFDICEEFRMCFSSRDHLVFGFV